MFDLYPSASSRALQVFRQTGMTRSKHLERQQNKIERDELAVSGALRFSETRMIWLQCEQTG